MHDIVVYDQSIFVAQQHVRQSEQTSHSAVELGSAVPAK